MTTPSFTWEDYERDFADRHLLHGAIAKWAAERPNTTAIIEFETGREFTYRELDETTTLWALRLLELGYRPGDYLATMLPLTVEHIFLEYACFKIGVIHAPLDQRLKPDEVVRSLGLIQAKGFVLLGHTPAADYTPVAQAVRSSCGYVEHLVQFAEAGDLAEGALPAQTLTEIGAATRDDPKLARLFTETTRAVRPTDGAQVIYTTGSTGFPKPALLSHRNITVQNLCLAGGCDWFDIKRTLVNLPPSHVGCQGEELMTTFFIGSTAVILHRFDAENSLRALERYKIESIGQIPSMFQMQWQLPNFADYDLSSLRSAMFGGQQVTRPFVERLKTMAPSVRAMDALQEIAEQKYGGTINKFVVTGGSKRGWTTWLSAVADKRVAGIAPIVIDTLNMRDQMKHQMETWGTYSEQIADYTSKGLVDVMKSQPDVPLWRWVDPYTYRGQLTLPKLLVNGTNDRYWVIDAMNLYWDGLQGDKHVLYVPNAGHGLDGGKEGALTTIAVFAQNVATNTPLPELSWKHEGEEGNGGMQLVVQSKPEPESVRLWVAHSDDKDFRPDRWEATTLTANAEGEFVGHVEKPATGHVAFFAEATYPFGPIKYNLSTQMRQE